MIADFPFAVYAHHFGIFTARIVDGFRAPALWLREEKCAIARGSGPGRASQDGGTAEHPPAGSA